MGNSLREQLLKAGLVDKSKVQQAKKQTRKKKRNKSATGEPDRIEQAVARAQADKAARDRELNRQKEIKQSAKARKGLLREYVEKNKLNDPAAEEPFNFVHGSSVKRLHVNAKQRDRLVAGKLAIVQVGERYYLVETEVAVKMQGMLPGIFVYIAEQDMPAEDDPYAEYQVPDDLMW